MLTYLSVFVKFVYPAILTGFGVAGNAYILEGQLRETKEDLRGQKSRDDLEGQLQELSDDLVGRAHTPQYNPEERMQGIRLDAKDKRSDIEDMKRELNKMERALEAQRWRLLTSLTEKFFEECRKDK